MPCNQFFIILKLNIINQATLDNMLKYDYGFNSNRLVGCINN